MEKRGGNNPYPALFSFSKLTDTPLGCRFQRLFVSCDSVSELIEGVPDRVNVFGTEKLSLDDSGTGCLNSQRFDSMPSHERPFNKHEVGHLVQGDCLLGFEPNPTFDPEVTILNPVPESFNLSLHESSSEDSEIDNPHEIADAIRASPEQFDPVNVVGEHLLLVNRYLDEVGLFIWSLQFVVTVWISIDRAILVLPTYKGLILCARHSLNDCVVIKTRKILKAFQKET